jgi:3-oxoacyl-[acyl-carrier protein] reductase
MDLELKRKVACGSVGIGLATAKAFAREGANVVIAGRSAERLAPAREEAAAGEVRVVCAQRDAALAEGVGAMMKLTVSTE